MKGTLFVDRLNKIKTIYFHGSCPDGIISREILKYHFKDTVKYKPYYFGEFAEIPKDALFIDCSPKSHQLRECLENNCLVAEHHNSFTEDYEHFKEEYIGQILLGDTAKAESGAYLAVEIVEDLHDESGLATFLPEPVYQLARLVAISDTWQKDQPDFEYARMLAGYVAFFGNDFCEDLVKLYNSEATIHAFGKVQQNKQLGLAKCAIRIQQGNMKVAFINELNMSNAADFLRTSENMDLIVGFSMKYEPNENKNIIIYSMRSKENGFDCSTFAKKYDGGGHKAAAGFSVEYAEHDPIGEFMGCLLAWQIEKLGNGPF